MSSRVVFDQSLPRPISLRAVVTILLGGGWNQLMWLWIGFAMILFWIFGMNTSGWDFLFDVSKLLRLGCTSTAMGHVVRLEPTRFSEGGPDLVGWADIRVFGYTYRFVGPDGRTRIGVSHDIEYRTYVGAERHIEFMTRNPDISRIEGMDSAPVGWILGVAVGYLLPMIGLGFIAYHVAKGLRLLGLLRRGRLALGTLKSVEEKRVDASPDIQATGILLTYVFKSDNGGTYELVTNAGPGRAAKKVLEDKEKALPCDALARLYLQHLAGDDREEEKEQPVLYDGRRPWRAVLLISIPGRPVIDTSGRVHFGSALCYGLLIIPMMTIAGHLGYALSRFLR